MFGWAIARAFSARWMIYGCLGAFIAGCGVTGWAAYKLDKAEERNALIDTIRVVRGVDKATRPVEDAHAKARNDAQVFERIVFKTVVKYVEPEKDPYCNLPVGAVRVLNDTRRGDLRAPTLEHDPEGEAPSTVTRDALVYEDLSCALQYNALRRDHDALIDWLIARDKTINGKK